MQFTGSFTMADQNEKAYQKQDAIFVGKKRVVGVKTKSKDIRWFKNVGLGFKTPAGAKEVGLAGGRCCWLNVRRPPHSAATPQ